MSDIGWHINSIPVLGTEPASENRIRSCCGSTSGIRFYCKPVTLVRCREIEGENRFSGRVVGKWLCEMTSAFIIKELRGARALRLFCGRSSFPPPSSYKIISNCYQFWHTAIGAVLLCGGEYSILSMTYWARTGGVFVFPLPFSPLHRFENFPDPERDPMH